MVYVWISVLIVVNLGWLLLIVLGIPGTWLMIASAIGLNWWQDEEIVGRWVLIGAAAVALIAEIIELVSGMAGSRRAGGSRWGAAGALIGAAAGAIIGTFAIPVPVGGSILGACGGAFLGAVLFELLAGRTMDHSVRSGTGAAVGRLVGLGAKLGAGVVIWIALAVSALV